MKIFLVWLIGHRNSLKVKAAFSDSNQKGYTIIELLVVVVMVGILAAIAAPSYLSFSNRQKVRTSQSQVYSALRNAQSLARTKNVAYQVNFREKDGVAQYVVIPTSAITLYTSADWDDSTKVFWQNLESGVKITYSSSMNTETPTSPQVYRMGFDASGNYVDLLNTYVKLAPSLGGALSCVTINTKLGAIRTLDQGESACN